MIKLTHSLTRRMKPWEAQTGLQLKEEASKGS